MAKTKPDVQLQSKKSVPTHAMFKKAGIESLRQEKTAQKKYATEKSTKAAKSTKKRKAKQLPEHPLAAAFSDSIQQSREHIQNKASDEVDAAFFGVSQRLEESNDHFHHLEQDAIEVTEALQYPLQDQTLEWISKDGKQSGETVLGRRMKTFQKTVEAEEEALQRQLDEWVKVQDEIRRVALEVVGPEGLERMMAGNLDTTTFTSVEQREMTEEIEVEKKRFKEQIEQAGKVSMKAMKDNEKQLKLKQREVEESFMAMLRDEEY
ncbi:hypothetical protein MMC28_005335 [Mycoblastus sanguinarius]|nr:hypothetical protein [Mycoblastus sanguinarius]